jgi:hypothetical protein
MLELKSIPTVTFCTTPFRTLVQTRRATLGLPDLPVVFLPHPMMTRTQAQLEALADKVMDEVVAGLLVPRACEEARQ